MVEAARVTKNERIDELFAETWEKHCSNVFRDGILCEEDFDAASLRVLCVAKEVNWHKGGNMRFAWVKNLCQSGQRFEPPLSRWAYGILNGFPPFKDMDKDKGGRLAAFKSIAIVNVKKTSGRSTSNPKVITDFAELWQEELRKQIEIIAPDVIISGNVPSAALTTLFCGLELKPSGCFKPPRDKTPVRVGRWHNCKIIDFRHPSRAPHRAYNVLRDVFKSPAFKAL